MAAWAIALFGQPAAAVTLAGDGVTDDTAALQAALDHAGQTASQVDLPPGQYLIKGSLDVPPGVALRGSWIAAHDAKLWTKGTTLLLTGGKGNESGTPAITLNQSSALCGVTLAWPEQQWDAIVAYPWAIKSQGNDVTVENVSLVNAYQGIDEALSPCHLVRNVYGTVLRRGICIDQCYDVGRLENIHFNTSYWINSGLGTMPEHIGGARKDVPRYTMQNLEAFTFGRTDCEYVFNTFVWGAKYAYHFIKTEAGDAYGQFAGIGADCCNVDILVDALQRPGLQITNGNFTAFAKPISVGLMVSSGVSAPVELVNCTFFGTPNGAAVLSGDNQVTLSGCHFVHRGKPAVIVANSGSVSIGNCSFGEKGIAALLGSRVRGAAVTGNLQPGGLLVENQAGDRAQIVGNEAPVVYSDAVLQHYVVNIGDLGDDEFIGDGWYGREGAASSSDKGKPAYNRSRWTEGEATVTLPVKSGAAYTARIRLAVISNKPPATVSIENGSAVIVQGGPPTAVTLEIPAQLTTGHRSLLLKIASKGWVPAHDEPGNGDKRLLGARVFAVEMTAAGSPGDAMELTASP